MTLSDGYRSFSLALVFAFGVLFLIVGSWWLGPILTLLILPHIALGLAWIMCSVSPGALAKFTVGLIKIDRANDSQVPRWRTNLLSSSLVASSLNLALFWALVATRLFQASMTTALALSGKVESCCDFLILFAICAGFIGKGRVRAPIILAALTGWSVWITAHIGIL